MNEENKIKRINKKRKDAIIEFVKQNPNCFKEEVIKHCNDLGVGSRATTWKAMDELEKEGILNSYKDKINSKWYKLNIRSENLLLTIPKNLDEIFNRFENFVKRIIDLFKGERKRYSKIKNSHLDLYDLSHQRSLSLLPINIIDIISDVLDFYFICMLSNRMDNNDNNFSKLNAIYNETIIKMYSYVFKNLNNRFFYSDKDTHFSFSTFDPPAYLESKKYINFEKVCYVSDICIVYDIDDNLFDILDFLWIKNIESTSLLYKEFINKHPVYKKENIDKNILDKLDNIDKHHVYNNDELNRIHECINQHVLKVVNDEKNKIKNSSCELM